MSEASVTGGARVALRLAADEAAVLAALAARLGLSRSAVLRAGLAALAAEVDGRRAAIPAPPSRTTQAVLALRAEVRRIGVNVNQAVRRINATGDAGDAELLLDLVGELETAVKVVGNG